MAQSTIIKKILEFFAKTFWPWFKDYIWPLLRKHVLEIFDSAISKLKEQFKAWTQTRFNARQEAATRKAQQAEDSAREASNDDERNAHEAVARVWREVAEQFREENDALKAKIEELTLVAKAEIVRQIHNSDPTIDTSSATPVLVLGEKRTSLPAITSKRD